MKIRVIKVLIGIPLVEKYLIQFNYGVQGWQNYLYCDSIEEYAKQVDLFIRDARFDFEEKIIWEWDSNTDFTVNLKNAESGGDFKANQIKKDKFISSRQELNPNTLNAKEIIEDLYQLSKPSIFGEWISCKDLLPEYNKDVLTLVGENYFVSCLMNNSFQEDYWSCQFYDYALEAINYWMPLPEMPNE